MKQVFKKRLSQFVILIELIVLGNFIIQQAFAESSPYDRATRRSAVVALVSELGTVISYLACGLSPVTSVFVGAGITSTCVGGGMGCLAYLDEREEAQRQEAEAQRQAVAANADASAPAPVALAEVPLVFQVAAPPPTVPQQLAQGDQDHEKESPHLVQPPRDPRFSSNHYDQSPSK